MDTGNWDPKSCEACNRSMGWSGERLCQPCRISDLEARLAAALAIVEPLEELAKKTASKEWRCEIASVHHAHGELGPAFQVTDADAGDGWIDCYKRVCTNHNREESNCVAGCYMTRGKLERERENAEHIAACDPATILRLAKALRGETE